MLTSIYSSGDSFVHTARPLLKVGLLFGLCTVLFIVESWPVLILMSALVGLLYACASISPNTIYLSIKPVLWVLALIFVVQIFLVDWLFAAFVVLRFLVMILAASLLTLTTKTSDLVSAIENFLSRFLPEKTSEAISLAFSLCLRFIPLVRDVFEDVRQAQKARGHEKNWRALITPTIVRTLKNADEISQAISARSIPTYHLSKSDMRDE